MKVARTVWTYTKSERIVRDSEDPEDPEDPGEVDKEALEAKIAEAEGLDEKEYTEESWAELVEALEAARTVVADEDATQEDIEEAYTNLVNAIEGLELVEEEPDPQPGDPQLVEAVFLEYPFLRNFGYVRIQVDGIEGAAKYRVQFFLNDDAEGKVPEWTEIMNIEGDDYESNLIFYMPEDKLTIEIYAEDGETLLHTFENVVPTRQ